MRLLVTIILVLVRPGPLAAQAYQSVYQPIQWFALTSNVKVHPRLSLLLDGHFRYAQNLNPMQMQIRTGLDFLVSKKMSVMPLGYVYVWNPIYGKQPAAYVNNEHRIFQQVTYNNSLGRLKMNHRFRLEQRFIQTHQNVNGEIIDNGYNLYLNRIRYRMLVNVPINGKEIVPNTLYGSFYDEIFIEFGKSAVYKDPDQNRFFLGLGYQINKVAALQAGYLYQKLIKLSGTMEENNTGFQVLFQYNFDLTTQ
jgi:hypothetical protein